MARNMTQHERGQRIARTLRMAHGGARASSILEPLAIWVGALGIVAGLLVAFQLRTADGAGHGVHPHVALGIGIIAGVVLLAVLLWLVARILGLLAEYVLLRVEPVTPEEASSSASRRLSGAGSRLRHSR